jgi:ParB-like chromosome segregation protein Spo0J
MAAAELEESIAVEPGATAERDKSDTMKMIDRIPETDIPVNSLVPGFYLRESGTDATHIRLLADAAGTVRLPPILVQRNGWRIIDGMHRIGAAKLRGEQTIRARVIDCTDEEALVLAIKSNTLHGLPLSKTDRISGAKRILAAHYDWSDRAVAEVAGLSAKTIAALRNRATGDALVSDKRLGRDGKRRPLSAAEGRRRAAEYLGEHPEARLRVAAREAGVSLGTVHDVRKRLRQGMDYATPERPGAAEGKPVTAAVRTDAPQSAADTATHAVPAAVSARRLTWAMISAKLMSDPTLRYTEGGRAFLRWMGMHSAQIDEWREFVDAVPIHWRGEVSRIAEAVSVEWRQFAELLRCEQA